MAYNILIVEDQEMPRQLFEIFVNSDSRLALVSSIRNADLALEICRNQPVDLILMDVCTAFGSNGLDASEIIKKEIPDIKIVIVTSMPEFSWLERAKQIGVDSFWYKEANQQTIIEVMIQTLNGKRIYPDTTPEVVFGNVTNHDFSERELTILQEILGGYSNTEIGEHLSISPGTVKRHIENMLEKTGFHTRTQLASEAGRLGIAMN